jgi:hypothetical protein
MFVILFLVSLILSYARLGYVHYGFDKEFLHYLRVLGGVGCRGEGRCSLISSSTG